MSGVHRVNLWSVCTVVHYGDRGLMGRGSYLSVESTLRVLAIGLLYYTGFLIVVVQLSMTTKNPRGKPNMNLWNALVVQPHVLHRNNFRYYYYWKCWTCRYP